MILVTPQDVLVIRMATDSLLECVRQTDRWWKACEDTAASDGTQQLVKTILATRCKFVGEDETDQMANALSVAEGLRDAAQRCSEEQSALRARLMGGAEAIEGLCQSERCGVGC